MTIKPRARRQKDDMVDDQSVELMGEIRMNDPIVNE